jgi:hypothetical protein
MKTTKVIFEHYLNNKSTNETNIACLIDLWKKSKTIRGLGTWIRTQKKDEFDKLYKIWKSQNESR